MNIYSSIAVSLASVVFLLSPTAMASQVNNANQVTWPTDIRDDLTDEQVRIATNLAGAKIKEIVQEKNCAGGNVDMFDRCIYKGYVFKAEGLDNYTVWLKSREDASAYQLILRRQGGMLFTSMHLSPEEIRAISVDFSQKLLDRDLRDIDPKDTDTFFDPRDLEFNSLLWRMSNKVRNHVEGKDCGFKTAFRFLNGEKTSCEISGYFIRDDGNYRHTILSKTAEGAAVAMSIQGGMPLIDVSVPRAEAIAVAKSVIHGTLNIDPDKIVINETAVGSSDKAMLAVASKAISFVEGKECGDSRLDDYLRGTPTDCEVAGYFVENDGDGNFTIHMKPEENSTNAVLWIADGKPLTRSYLTETEIETIKQKLTGAFLAAENNKTAP